MKSNISTRWLDVRLPGQAEPRLILKEQDRLVRGRTTSVTYLAMILLAAYACVDSDLIWLIIHVFEDSHLYNPHNHHLDGMQHCCLIRFKMTQKQEKNAWQISSLSVVSFHFIVYIMQQVDTAVAWQCGFHCSWRSSFEQFHRISRVLAFMAIGPSQHAALSYDAVPVADRVLRNRPETWWTLGHFVQVNGDSSSTKCTLRGADCLASGAV